MNTTSSTMTSRIAIGMTALIVMFVGVLSLPSTSHAALEKFSAAAKQHKVNIAEKLSEGVGFRIDHQENSPWVKMRARMDNKHVFPVTKSLDALWAKLEGKSQKEALNIVNGYWNQHISYMPDRKNYGRKDYWASPMETATRRTGDCEDYAIVKYYSLRRIGFADNDLRVMILSNKKGTIHSVLAASVEEKVYVLDNLRDDVVPLSSYTYGKVHQAFNEDDRYSYVYPNAG